MVAIAIAMVFLLAGRMAAARGLVLGTLFSIVNFTLLAYALPLQLNKGRKQTFLFCFGSIGVRYLLMALPVLIAAQSERFSLFGAAAGLFMVQAVILFHQLGPRFTTMIGGRKNDQVSLSRTDDL